MTATAQAAFKTTNIHQARKAVLIRGLAYDLLCQHILLLHLRTDAKTCPGVCKCKHEKAAHADAQQLTRKFFLSNLQILMCGDL